MPVKGITDRGLAPREDLVWVPEASAAEGPSAAPCVCFKLKEEGECSLGFLSSDKEAVLSSQELL